MGKDVVPNFILRKAREMLEDLDEGWLEVGKFPGQYGEGMVRMVISNER